MVLQLELVVYGGKVEINFPWTVKKSFPNFLIGVTGDSPQVKVSFGFKWHLIK